MGLFGSKFVLTVTRKMTLSGVTIGRVDRILFYISIFFFVDDIRCIV